MEQVFLQSLPEKKFGEKQLESSERSETPGSSLPYRDRRPFLGTEAKRAVWNHEQGSIISKPIMFKTTKPHQPVQGRTHKAQDGGTQRGDVPEAVFLRSQLLSVFTQRQVCWASPTPLLGPFSVDTFPPALCPLSLYATKTGRGPEISYPIY